MASARSQRLSLGAIDTSREQLRKWARGQSGTHEGGATRNAAFSAKLGQSVPHSDIAPSQIASEFRVVVRARPQTDLFSPHVLRAQSRPHSCICAGNLEVLTPEPNQKKPSLSRSIEVTLPVFQISTKKVYERKFDSILFSYIVAKSILTPTQF